MIKKKLTKLVGLKKEEFDEYVESGQIQVQPARLIPTLKTGDEMALTSIFLSVVRLVKEYRASFFKEIKLPLGGKAYYFTEASFPDIDKSRIDGLIIIVVSGKIKDAAFFEMKNKNNSIDAKQVETYLGITRKLGVNKLITVSNEFVADPTHSPVKVKPPKSIALLHFSWTYLLTKGQLLMFNNDNNIEDEDQVEIMHEALAYLESPVSGVSGYTQMKPGWKQLAENIRAQKPLKVSDVYIEDAVASWYEEEKDIALLMSRKLGVLVKSSTKTKDSLKNDIKRVVKSNYLKGKLNVKNAVSDISIKAEFERRTVTMSVKITPPQDKGTVAKIGWVNKQMEGCKKKHPALFTQLEDSIWIEADIKFAKENLKVKLNELGELTEQSKGKEIQGFYIVLIKGFGANFASNKKFIELIEKMTLDYYAAIVQQMSSWNRPAPKLN
jgi:flagellar motility protein MotE (MotC chaperone)